MNDLSKKKCQPCEGGVAALTPAAAKELLKAIPNWQLNDNATELSRQFTFKNFFRTMSFVNAVAHIANQENHHPDLQVSYQYCLVKYSTHAIGGLSENDFICASKVDALLDN